ncbi:MAG TPA: sensor histidine kinase [Bryobacteraceae bacterium]|nr:sensor histidine kinase [Bryobacteraceae bacterium]
MPSEKVSFHPKIAASPPSEEPEPARVRLLTMRGGLVLGFGVLLVLLILSGLSALRALAEVQNANQNSLQQFLAKNQQLDEVRAAVYLSGTYLRDYLLEPDRAKAEQSRAELVDAKSRIQSLLADNGPVSQAGDHEMFNALKRELADYWQTLEPVLSWSPEQRSAEGYTFLRDEVFPRRSNTLAIADNIRSLDQQQLMRRDEELLSQFASVRGHLVLALVVMLLVGMGQAYFSTSHLLRLENQTLKHLQDVTEARQELKDLSAKLVATQENERKSISRDLHDAVGQSMSAVQFELHDLAVMLRPYDKELRERVDRVREQVENSLAVIRNMALLLRPAMLDDLGLAAALGWLAREIARPTGLRIQVQADDLPPDLPDEHKTCVFRIAQEALHNIQKHANANAVEITVRASDAWLVVTVQDDGRGFQQVRAHGLGLTGMHERAESLGGSVKINSGPGKGTLIEVALPLPQRLQAAPPNLFPPDPAASPELPRPWDYRG